MTVVPVHGREEIGPGLLTRILRDCQLTRDELQEENDLYIHQIAVDPARQGTGVGSWLLQRIDEVARARGLGGLSLQTAEMAVANIRLYQRHGFEIVRRGPPDHGLDPHTRVYMIKSLQVGSS